MMDGIPRIALVCCIQAWVSIGRTGSSRCRGTVNAHFGPLSHILATVNLIGLQREAKKLQKIPLVTISTLKILNLPSSSNWFTQNIYCLIICEIFKRNIVYL